MCNFANRSFFLLIAAVIFLFPANSFAAVKFSNPILKSSGNECDTGNLRRERLSAGFNADEQMRLCAAINDISTKLNSTDWSPELSDELRQIWRTFSNQPISLRPMPAGNSSRVLALAEAFPDGNFNGEFNACIYVRPVKSGGDQFFQIMMHELRHVYDAYETWKNKTSISSYEMEKRAFSLMGKIEQNKNKNSIFSNLPSFWNESWRKLSTQEIDTRRNAAIEKYLQKNKSYLDLLISQQMLDFSYLKRHQTRAITQNEVVKYQKPDGEILPERPLIPSVEQTITQNITEADFKLDKPKNTRDEKEILRVALSNEKKIYYGMSNFVYDLNLQFSCWKKGKVIAQLNQKDQIARTTGGGALKQLPTAPAAYNSPSCVSNFRDLQTDFTETFWASPALEKMPITFAGFYEVDGKTLARYTVLKPDAKLYNQLAREYPEIAPFRVFVGTIFVSPEDGQIVRFWGTSYPENSVTNNEASRILASYSVNALRQKVDINGGVWMTVHIGTVALANIGSNPRPFSYTVSFENYRQTTTDVKILDDETQAGNFVSVAENKSQNHK